MTVWAEQAETIRRLTEEGKTPEDIARQVELLSTLVKNYDEAVTEHGHQRPNRPAPPGDQDSEEEGSNPKARVIDPFKDYIVSRMNGGMEHTKTMLKELGGKRLHRKRDNPEDLHETIPETQDTPGKTAGRPPIHRGADDAENLRTDE